MGIGVAQASPSKPVTDSKVGKVAAGFASGGYVGAALALLGGNNSTAGQLAGAAMSGSDKAPTAFERRMEKANEPTPEDHLDNGIQLLDHPDVPPEVAAMAAPYLLGAKHFGGPHPELDRALGNVRSDSEEA